MYRMNVQTQRGFALVDTLLGLVILGVFITTLLSALSTGFIGLKTSQDVSVAESLARSQMENIKGQGYLTAGGYSQIVSPSGYSIGIAAETISGVDPSQMQQVAVTVSHGSEVIRVLRDFKVNR